MGLAAARVLTHRGHVVTALERHGLVHALGSHGGSMPDGSSFRPMARVWLAYWLLPPSDAAKGTPRPTKPTTSSFDHATAAGVTDCGDCHNASDTDLRGDP